jgi:hypothetical protein
MKMYVKITGIIIVQVHLLNAGAANICSLDITRLYASRPRRLFPLTGFYSACTAVLWTIWTYRNGFREIRVEITSFFLCKGLSGNNCWV